MTNVILITLYSWNFGTQMTQILQICTDFLWIDLRKSVVSALSACYYKVVAWIFIIMSIVINRGLRLGIRCY